jgi:hypothetical protein
VKQPKTLFEKYQAIQKIGSTVEVPFNVSRLVQGSGHKRLEIVNTMVGLGGEADWAELDEVRGALQWYVEQLGGEVKWK